MIFGLWRGGILVAADSTPTLNLGREETTGGVSYVRSVPRGWLGGQLMVLAANCALFG